MIVTNGAFLRCPALQLPHLRTKVGIADKRELESRTHDADDRVGFAIELDVAANHCRIGAEMVAPERIANDNFVIVAGLILALDEGAAQQGLCTKYREQSIGRRNERHVNGLAGSGQGVTAKAVSRHAFEAVSLGTPVEKISRRNGKQGNAGKACLRRCVIELDEAIRLIEGKWAQKYGIYHAEDCRVRANPQSEYKNGYRGKSRALAQSPPAIPDVLQQIRHPSSPSVFIRTTSRRCSQEMKKMQFDGHFVNA